MITSLEAKPSSFIYNTHRLIRRDLTKDLWEEYSTEIMKMVVGQYYNKDPSSRGLSYDELYKYFKEEYDQIFTNDITFVHAFLFFTTNNELVGTFMFRDAVLYTKEHKKTLDKMMPGDSFYDYYVQFCKIADAYWKKYNVEEGHCLYGTNLAFSAKYLANFKEREVLLMILAVFIDLNNWWREKRLSEGKYRYSMWTQFRKSLITTTQSLFKCLEGEDFKFIAGDNSKVEGKLFFVEQKTEEENRELWRKSAKL